MRILMSIKPCYVEKILTGEKRYEFRKRRGKKDIDVILVYATAPVKKVVAEIEVLDILEGVPSDIWKKTKDNSGIAKENYDKYFCGCDKAIAYALGNVTKFNPMRSLEDYGLKLPPQSFIYL